MTINNQLLSIGGYAPPVAEISRSGLKSVQVFDSSSAHGGAGHVTHTWTKPEGVTVIRVQCQGSGASGNTSGKSGGAGGYSEKIIDVTNIVSETVTTGNSESGHNNSGHTSSFGSHLSATGGYNNSSNKSPYAATDGGYGGSGVGGDINSNGGGGNSAKAGDGGFAGAASYFGGGSSGQNTSNKGTHPQAYGSAGAGCNNGYGSGTGQQGCVIVWEYA